jgi:hypothetical protein
MEMPRHTRNYSGASYLRIAAVVALAIAALPSTVNAQRRGQATGPEVSAQAFAPMDITGHWVSLITDDWVYRMITPAHGDYSYIPLNPEGSRVADTWDAARDAAAGEDCKAYSAPAIMRLPNRVHITWQDESTLKLDIDTGMQTRLFHFRDNAPMGARSWQGWSAAQWEVSGDTSRRRGFYQLSGSLGDVERFGSLRVETSNLRAGYLRRNGVPYSKDAEMTEYFNVLTEEDGGQYLVIQTYVSDPTYLNQHLVRTLEYKREPNGSKRQPLDCTASEALFQSAEGAPRPDGDGPPLPSR